MSDQRPPDPAAGKKNFERFCRALEQNARATDDHSKLLEGLIEILTHRENGAIATMDDLLIEVRGLREDIRTMAQHPGVPGINLGDIGKLFRRRG